MCLLNCLTGPSVVSSPSPLPLPLFFSTLSFIFPPGPLRTGSHILWRAILELWPTAFFPQPGWCVLVRHHLFGHLFSSLAPSQIFKITVFTVFQMFRNRRTLLCLVTPPPYPTFPTPIAHRHGFQWIGFARALCLGSSFFPPGTPPLCLSPLHFSPAAESGTFRPCR